MAISKRIRFEVFKRDGFVCQYCGNKPPDVVLEADHIDPHSRGGGDDMVNLITSCFDCNRGKSDRTLTAVEVRPDAVMMAAAVQQEVAEVKLYLEAKDEEEDALLPLYQHLDAVWGACVDKYKILDYHQLVRWLHEFAPDEIEYAITITGEKKRSGQLRDVSNGGAYKYMWGVLRGERQRAAS